MTALFWFTIRQVLWDRKVWVTALLLGSPAGLALLVRFFDLESDPRELQQMFHAVTLNLLLGIVIPIVCMLHGTALITSEVEGRTLVYLITRKLRRGTVFLTRFLALALLLTLICQLATVLLYAVTMTGRTDPVEAGALGGGFWADVPVYVLHLPLAVSAYLAVFALFGVVFRRPVAASVFLLFVWEALIGNQQVELRSYTLSHQVRIDLVHEIPLAADVLPVDARDADKLFPPDATGLDNLLMVTAGALILAFFLVTHRELVPARVARE